MIYFIYLILVLIVLFIFLFFIKKKEEKIKNWKYLFLLFLIGFILSDLLGGLTGLYITKPIIDLINPPQSEILIEPLFNPIIKEGKEYIRVNYKNVGDTSLTNILIEKRFSEDYTTNGDKTYKLMSISTNTLSSKGEEGYFEFDSPNQTIQCKDRPNFNIILYVDNKGNIYQKNEGLNPKGCIFVPLRIRFYSDKINRTLNFLYPINGSFDTTFYINDKKTIPYLESPDESNLIDYKAFKNCRFHNRYSFCKKGFGSTETCMSDVKDPDMLVEINCLLKGEEVSFNIFY